MALDPYEQRRDDKFNNETPDSIKLVINGMVGAALAVLRAMGYPLPEGDTLIVFRNATTDYFHVAYHAAIDLIHAEQRKKTN